MPTRLHALGPRVGEICLVPATEPLTFGTDRTVKWEALLGNPVAQRAVCTPAVVDVRQGRVPAARQHSGTNPVVAVDVLVGDDADLNIHEAVHIHHVETEKRVT